MPLTAHNASVRSCLIEAAYGINSEAEFPSLAADIFPDSGLGPKKEVAGRAEDAPKRGNPSLLAGHLRAG